MRKEPLQAEESVCAHRLQCPKNKKKTRNSKSKQKSTIYFRIFLQLVKNTPQNVKIPTENAALSSAIPGI